DLEVAARAEAEQRRGEGAVVRAHAVDEAHSGRPEPDCRLVARKARAFSRIPPDARPAPVEEAEQDARPAEACQHAAVRLQEPPGALRGLRARHHALRERDHYGHALARLERPRRAERGHALARERLVVAALRTDRA